MAGPRVDEELAGFLQDWEESLDVADGKTAVTRDALDRRPGVAAVGVRFIGDGDHHETGSQLRFRIR